MAMHITIKSIVHIAVLIVLAALTGCATTPFADRYQPGASEVVMWGSETIPVDPGWRFLGDEQASVRGRLRDTSLTPVDHLQTLVFAREGDGGPSILLISRVVKMGSREVFVFLGGEKTEIDGRPYRENIYSLSSDTADPEYRRYFARVAAAGLAPAPSYRVRILDRLPVDTVLVRVMELTPAEGASTLPPYGRLYPQELRDSIIRGFN